MMHYGYPTPALVFPTPYNYSFPYYNYQPWCVQPNPEYKRGFNDVGIYQYGNSFVAQPFTDVLQTSWNSPFHNWLGNQQLYFHADHWKCSLPYNWMNMNANYNRGIYWSWPTMNYFPQPQYAMYSWPETTYWKTETTYSPETTPPSKNNVEGPQNAVFYSSKQPSTKPLKEYLPVEVAKRTVSEVRRITETSISIKDPADNSDQRGKPNEDALPYVVNISDASIRQITSSRSFLGSGIVTKSGSDI